MSCKFPLIAKFYVTTFISRAHPCKVEHGCVPTLAVYIFKDSLFVPSFSNQGIQKAGEIKRERDSLLNPTAAKR